MEERYLLAKERIEEIINEDILSGELRDFFSREAEFLVYGTKIYERIKESGILNNGRVSEGELDSFPLDELKEINRKLYAFADATNVGKVDDACDVNGTKNSYLLALSAELRGIIPYIFEHKLEMIVIRMELFLEFYNSYVTAVQENESVKDEYLKEILYYYVSDYIGLGLEENVHEKLSTEDSFAKNLICTADWTDVKSLYLYGEYVTDVEETTLEHLNSLPYETLKKMADTFTEGYRIGFATTNKDISKKKIVEIRYNLGFEPMVKIAIENFKEIGLETSIARGRMNLLNGRGINRIGFEGACPGRQYEFEHKDDVALVLDSKITTIKLEAFKKAFEKHKKEASLFGGPAVIEVFGEKAPDYITKDTAPSYSEEQQKLLRKYTAEASAIQNEYILEEERSFTIISFPTPDICDDLHNTDDKNDNDSLHNEALYARIFNETIAINTLDYKLYQNVQQTIINTLDKGEYVIVKGMGANKTNLRVSLHNLQNPNTQTNFENCVADVNIPVGEVFTSPILKETEGVLNVTKVYLEGLEYKNIMLTIKDGMISDYSCENFPTLKENRKYIFDNILFHHESLPMGEFAIGTNTTAYVMARKYGIEDRMPILIAEKTGPHFAFGDTCYSYCEEVPMYNPDGKEVIARDNECSLQRNEDPLKAYFNCHTDITIPYDELGEISVVTKDNDVIVIIENGRFVLPGCEVLNEPL